MYNYNKMPKYPKPIPIVIKIFWAGIFRRKLSFHATSQYCIKRLKPPLKVLGQENIPRNGPLLLLTNHYTHPGFPSWWVSLSISSIIPLEIHWIMAAAFTSPDPLYTRIVTPITFWAFARFAWVYGFTPMPPCRHVHPMSQIGLWQSARCFRMYVIPKILWLDWFQKGKMSLEMD